MKRIGVLMGISILSLTVHALPSAKDLSLRELVGQTVMPRVIIGKHHVYKKAVQNGEVTGFFIKTFPGLVTHPNLTVRNREQFIKKQRQKLIQTITDLQTWAQQSKHQIPLLFAVDYEGGTVTSPMYLGLPQAPSNMLLVATGEVQAVADMYAAMAQELRAVGVNVLLGPVSDVNTNPAHIILQTRAFGDEPYLAGQLAAVAAQAAEANGVAAVNKHFPGHGDASADSHIEQPIADLPEEELWQKHIMAFAPSIGISSGMMTNHVLYPALDPKRTAVFSAAIIQGLLRDKMGFTGLVFTDALGMRGVGEKSLQDIVLDAYNAGNDVLLLVSSNEADLKDNATYPRLAADYVEQEVSSSYPLFGRERLERSVQQILNLKARLQQVIQPAEVDFEQTATRVARKGVTLVRNTKNEVPFSSSVSAVCSVFLADGIFSTQLEHFNVVLEASGRQVERVFLPVSPAEKDHARALKCVENAQAVVVGTSTKLVKPDAAQYSLVSELLREATFTRKPFVQISLLSPYEISSYPNVPAMLAVYGPTEPAMQTAAQILTGKLPALGTLPVKL